MAAETRGPCQNFVHEIEAVARRYSRSHESESSRGWDEHIHQAVKDMLEGHYTAPGMGIHAGAPLTPPRAASSLEIHHVQFDLGRIPWRLPGDVAPATPPHAVAPVPLPVGAAPLVWSPLPASSEPREELCESPSKKMRTGLDCASPVVPNWAKDPHREGGSGAPVASPCRSGPVGRGTASGLGPVPKDPPPSTVEDQADEPRELSSPKKRLRDRPGNSPSPSPAARIGKAPGASDDRPAWATQHSALFAPPAAAKAAAPLAKCPPVRRPMDAGATGSMGRAQPPAATSMDAMRGTPSSVADMVRQIDAGAGEKSTPVSVLDRCRLFEAPKSTPGWRKPGSASGLPAASPGVGATGQAGPASNGTSQLSMPNAIKPKALFGGPTDSSSRSNSGAPTFKTPPVTPVTAVADGSIRLAVAHKVQMPSRPASLKEPAKLKHVASNSSLHSGSMGLSAPAPIQLKQSPSSSSLRSGGMGAPPAQLKHTASSSSLGAPQRLTASALAALAVSGGPAERPLPSAPVPAAIPGPVTNSSPAAVEAVKAAEPKRKANRRSACLYPEQEPSAAATAQLAAASMAASSAPVAAAAPAPQEPSAAATAQLAAPVAAAAPAPASSSADSSAVAQKGIRPPVPLFSESQSTPQRQERLEPCMELRQIEVPPKRPEDNYEISEQGGDSDGEESQAKDRSSKHVPKWCLDYLGDLSKQCDIDPDTIFGNKVPQCVLEDIFNNEMYRQAGKSRPKRQRGSSGDWRKDRLTRTEITHYKSRMGHTRAWNPDNK